MFCARLINIALYTDIVNYLHDLDVIYIASPITPLQPCHAAILARNMSSLKSHVSRPRMVRIGLLAAEYQVYILRQPETTTKQLVIQNFLKDKKTGS